MREFIAATVFLALAIPYAAANEKDDAAKKLNGTYEITEFLVGGKPAAGNKGATMTVTIQDGTITLQDGEKRMEVARFTLDPGKKPAHIDLMPPKQMVVLPGIYETRVTNKGFELIIAHSLDKAGPRPTDFKGHGEKRHS